MSLDSQNTNSMDDMASMPRKSGGKLKWIFGGCGCLGLLALLCFGGVLWFGFNMINQAQQEAKSFVESSSVVQKQLGSPVTIEGEAVSNGPDGAPVFVFDVSGPDGSGKVTAMSVPDGEAFDFVISKYTLEVDGQEFDLNQDEELGIEIEGMDDF